MASSNVTAEQRQRFEEAERRALRGECPDCLGLCQGTKRCLRAEELGIPLLDREHNGE